MNAGDAEEGVEASGAYGSPGGWTCKKVLAKDDSGVALWCSLVFQANGIGEHDRMILHILGAYEKSIYIDGG